MTVTNKDLLKTFKRGEIVEIDGQLVDPEIARYRSNSEYKKKK